MRRKEFDMSNSDNEQLQAPLAVSVHCITPVLDKKVRHLCFKSYYNHPKGCPNYNKRRTCPPAAPLLSDFFDVNKKVMAVCVDFDLGQHIEKMKSKHPHWSQRQLECCLYWQGTVRKKLREEVAYSLTRYSLLREDKLASTDCPEAMGVDVTATMKAVGIILEWPPKKIVRKIAFIGTMLKLKTALA